MKVPVKVPGELEQVVLLAILRLGEGAYGLNTRDEIERCTGRAVARGALYVTLDRLEEKGWIRSWAGEGGSERGGRRRRCLEVTPRGLEALRGARRVWLSLWQGIERRLDEGQESS